MDRKKVIKGLECAIGIRGIKNCDGCPYDNDFNCLGCDIVMRDALELLKEQDQPTRPVYNGRYWECEQCKERYKDILAVKEYKHCPGCGRRIEWQ